MVFFILKFTLAGGPANNKDVSQYIHSMLNHRVSRNYSNLWKIDAYLDLLSNSQKIFKPSYATSIK